MPLPSDDFYRINKLPPYVFAVINELKAKARADNLDIIDMGMGNPDGATPQPVVDKLIEAARNPRNHRYSVSRGIPNLREAIVARYKKQYDVTLDSESEAIVTIGAKDALAHLLFAIIGPGDAVVSANPAYPIHQYGVIMAEGEACMLPMPDAGTFLEGTIRPRLVSTLTSCERLSTWPGNMGRISFTTLPMPNWASMDIGLPAFCRWKERLTMRLRSTR
jgi:alanine-synthesizing transaminase